MDSLPEDAGAGPLALAVLSRFRLDFHACLTARADELCELADAVLCAELRAWADSRGCRPARQWKAPQQPARQVSAGPQRGRASRRVMRTALPPVTPAQRIAQCSDE